MNRHSFASFSIVSFVLLASSLVLSSCTNPGRCRLGSVGCFCEGSSCAPGGICKSGMCEACTPGSANCTCAPAPGAPCAGPDLACNNGTCQACNLGDLNCGCTQAGACNMGSTCNNGRCVACTNGEQGCPCGASEACNTGLTCVRATNTCVTTSQTQCNDDCYWWGDGSCDDGGPNSAYSACDLGSDCTDCGARACPPGAEGCRCTSSGGCNTGLTCLRLEDRCFATANTWCDDTCPYAGDNYCDDGGVGSTTHWCGHGTDCTDCGPRENICLDGHYTYYADTTYCPDTEISPAASAPNGCWPTGVDCTTATDCGNTGDWLVCTALHPVLCGTTAPGDSTCTP